VKTGHVLALLVETLRYKPKVACSIPDEVLEIFRYLHPSGSTVVLGLTQDVTEMCTRNISWGVKAAGA